MKKRQTLESLLAPTQELSRPPERSLNPQVTSGALKAMGMSLRQMSEDAARARDLTAQMETGERIVELDVSLIEPSFVTDRFDGDGGDGIADLVQSIADEGQQLPILVRPHPKAAGRYEVAYGHRRLAASRQLGRSVRAIIKPLSDVELVVAQGKENSERRDLSFCERSMFAKALEDRGFDRKTVMAALGLSSKGDLSVLINVASTIPTEVIRAIGAAPGIGKPRWLELVRSFELKRGRKQQLDVIIASDAFRRLNSDQRFAAVLKAMSDRPHQTELPRVWTEPHGKTVVSVKQTKGTARLMIDERKAPDFSVFVLQQMPQLYANYRKERG